MNKILKLGLALSLFMACSIEVKAADKDDHYHYGWGGYGYGNRSTELIHRRVTNELEEAKKAGDQKRIKELEGRLADIEGRSGTSGMISVLKKEFGLEGNGWKPMVCGIATVCTITPIIMAFKDFWKDVFTGSLKEQFSIVFKKFFGGFKFKITSTANHCDNIFCQLRTLVREATGYASREVGRAMNARDRVPDVLGQAQKESEKTEESDQAEKYVCPVCQTPDGNMEFFYSCKAGEKHGIHPVCARKWFLEKRVDSLSCPTCRAPRKFEVMEPDVVVSALTENLALTSALPSIVLSLKSAQRRIAGLVRQLEKDKSKSQYMTEKSLLIALHMDMDQICEVVDRCKSYKEFCNQDVLEKLSIYATKGSNNCKILRSFVEGNFDFSSKGSSQSPYYGGAASGAYGSSYGGG